VHLTPRSALSEDPSLAALAACGLFAALPTEALLSLAGAARRQRYAPGQALFRVGDTSDAIFVLCSGRVQARVVSGDGRVVVWHVAGRGEAPGYVDLMDRSERSVDAVAVDDVEALVLRAALVREVLLAHPPALMHVAADLAAIVRTLTDAAADLLFLDLPARLAKLLLARAASGERVELGVTQSELAEQLGVARQSINRALGGLQRQGLIRVRRGTDVELLDRPALRRLAAGNR
jgi:CRP-like cAMP-binding protein